MGALDGLRPNQWAASVNYRASKGDELGIIYTQQRLEQGVLLFVPMNHSSKLSLLLGALPAPVLLREVLNTTATYADAVDKFRTDKILSEFYFIVGVFPTVMAVGARFSIHP